MPVGSGDVRSGSQRLAAVLLDDVDQIAGHSAARMQELLASYAKVARRELTRRPSAKTRHLLEAIRDPNVDPSRAQDDYRALGDARARQGITSDELIQAWRIGLESVREKAYAVADGLGIGKDALIEFVEATLRWGEIGLRASASALHEAVLRELGRPTEQQAALPVGAMLAASTRAEPIPANIESRIAQFTDLVATAMPTSMRGPIWPRRGLGSRSPPTTSAAGLCVTCTTGRSSAWCTRS